MTSSQATEKPTAAFILSLIGGIIVLLSGIYVLFVVSIVSSAVSSYYYNNPLFYLLYGFGFLGVVWGILMLIGGILLYASPNQHHIWGAVVLVFSIASWFGTFGGFVVGFILGLVGGILGIVWKPTSKPVVFVPPPPPPSL